MSITYQVLPRLLVLSFGEKPELYANLLTYTKIKIPNNLSSEIKYASKDIITSNDGKKYFIRVKRGVHPKINIYQLYKGGKRKFELEITKAPRLCELLLVFYDYFIFNLEGKVHYGKLQGKKIILISTFNPVKHAQFFPLNSTELLVIDGFSGKFLIFEFDVLTPFYLKYSGSLKHLKKTEKLPPFRTGSVISLSEKEFVTYNKERISIYQLQFDSYNLIQEIPLVGHGDLTKITSNLFTISYAKDEDREIRIYRRTIGEFFLYQVIEKRRSKIIPLPPGRNEIIKLATLLPLELPLPLDLKIEITEFCIAN